MTSRNTSYLERLLTSLETQVRGFALCKLHRGYQLMLGALEAPLIHYAVRGSGVLQIEGAKPIAFAQHDLIVLPPGRAHSIAAPNGKVQEVAGPAELAMIDDGLVELSAGGGEDVVTACGVIEASYGGRIGLFHAIREPILVSLSDDERFQSVIASMIEELSAPTFGTRAVVEALMKQSLVLIIRRQLEGRDTRSAWFLPSGDTRLSTALEMMLERPSAPHTLRGLAAATGMSRSGFALRFLRTFGQPPMAFLRDLRLRHAARLLQVTDLPVEAIADSVGYSSRSYLSRSFRNLFGMDPRSFRASQR